MSATKTTKTQKVLLAEANKIFDMCARLKKLVAGMEESVDQRRIMKIIDELQVQKNRLYDLSEY